MPNGRSARNGAEAALGSAPNSKAGRSIWNHHNHISDSQNVASSEANQVAVCLWLADNGLDLTRQPLPILALLQQAELVPVIKRLVDLGANPDAEIRDGEFRGPLHAYA